MDKHDRSSDLIGHLPFRCLGDIVAHDVRVTIFLCDVVFVEVGYGVAVVEAEEGSLWSHKFWVEGADDLGGYGVGEEEVDDFAYLQDVSMYLMRKSRGHHVFEVVKEVLELDKDKLCLQVSVLRKMPGRRSAEGRRTAKYERTALSSSSQL